MLLAHMQIDYFYQKHIHTVLGILTQCTVHIVTITNQKQPNMLSLHVPISQRWDYIFLIKLNMVYWKLQTALNAKAIQHFRLWQEPNNSFPSKSLNFLYPWRSVLIVQLYSSFIIQYLVFTKQKLFIFIVWGNGSSKTCNTHIAKSSCFHVK